MKKKKTIVIEVMGGLIADIWTDTEAEVLIFDYDQREVSKVAVNRQIPDFALPYLNLKGKTEWRKEAK